MRELVIQAANNLQEFDGLFDKTSETYEEYLQKLNDQELLDLYGWLIEERLTKHIFCVRFGK